MLIPEAPSQTQVGDLQRYGTVWFNAAGIANILSLHRITTRLNVTFHSQLDSHFFVWKENSQVQHFISGPRDLYYCGITKIQGTIISATATIITISDTVTNNTMEIAVTNIDIVVGNTLFYNYRQIDEAKYARKFQNSRSALSCRYEGDSQLSHHTTIHKRCTSYVWT